MPPSALLKPSARADRVEARVVDLAGVHKLVRAGAHELVCAGAHELVRAGAHELVGAAAHELAQSRSSGQELRLRQHALLQ